MSRFSLKRSAKQAAPKLTPSRFASHAFRSASPEEAQRLCEQLAKQAARSFVELTGKSPSAEGPPIVKELRASGHDMVCGEDTAELQQWQATLYHPTGTFALLLTYRAPRSVEVIWRTDDAEFTARA